MTDQRLDEPMTITAAARLAAELNRCVNPDTGRAADRTSLLRHVQKLPELNLAGEGRRPLVRPAQLFASYESDPQRRVMAGHLVRSGAAADPAPSSAPVPAAAPTPVETDDEPVDVLSDRRRLERAKADTAELELAQLRGELVPVVEIQAALAEALVTAVRVIDQAGRARAQDLVTELGLTGRGAKMTRDRLVSHGREIRNALWQAFQAAAASLEPGETRRAAARRLATLAVAADRLRRAGETDTRDAA